MSLLTAKEIMEILPHRWPFMLLDTVEELTPGVRAGNDCLSGFRKENQTCRCCGKQLYLYILWKLFPCENQKQNPYGL